ncbi:serine/threonine protein kinase [Stieleria sp. TO1_6]|uniref:serine/threonine-protein kinase n=1 Tax=Stieleria tagensis TaxID=2956795 RepID=UPI00209A8180|nr:serine/threonine-protein kinase [Stieleria tagensis]MCO8120863.1 serine/threonine protein kinase [Stieleria tagensis]
MSEQRPQKQVSPDDCPDEDQWHDWVAAEGDVALADDVLLAHLDRCPSCQDRVAALSERDAFFRQSRQALQASGLSSRDWLDDLADSPTQVLHQPQATDQAHPAILSLVKTLLGPTEDEYSLGRLGRFEVLGVVGSGGMGIVLKARSVDVDRIVAVKLPLPQYWQSPDTLLTLEREARSAAAVVHPNVISIYHVDRYRDVPYLVMPYLPGQSLQQRIRDAGALSIDETLRIGRQVASALAAAHACGVVHRDVKPANILLGAGTERVVLSDFGLAKVQTDATCTATGTFAGTPIYLSPEQALGHGAGPAGDIYSLGTVFWTMLCGTPPMAGMHTHAIVRQIADSKLPSLSENCPGLPEWLNRMLARMHANEPVNRPSAEQLVDWIAACQRHQNDKRSPLPAELMTNVKQRPTWLGWALPVGAVILMLISAMALRHSQTTDPTQITQQPSAEPALVAPSATAEKVSATADPATSESDSIETRDPAISTSPTVTFEPFLDQVRTELETIQQVTLPRWENTIGDLEQNALPPPTSSPLPPTGQ